MTDKKYFQMFSGAIVLFWFLSVCNLVSSPPTTEPAIEPISTTQTGESGSKPVEIIPTSASTSVPLNAPINIYDQETLEFWQTRYPDSTRRIYDEAFMPIFSPEERAALADVQLQFPLVSEGVFQADPLAFYATSNPPTVYMPIHSLKFLDDLSVAYAWLFWNGYSLETVTDYISMLKYQRNDFLENGFPAPLAALQIPEDALDDPDVDQLALRFFNSGRAFILAHELGHIYHNHPGNLSVSVQESVSNEQEADLYALDILARTSTIPFGAYLFYLVRAHWEPNLGDFQNEAAWQSYLAQTTHPFTADRMNVLADNLSNNAADFTQNEPNPTAALDTINFIANGMSDIANTLDDPDIQLSLAFKGRATVLEFLAPRLPGMLPCDYDIELDNEQGSPAPFHGIYRGEYIRPLADSTTEELPMCLVLNRKNDRVTGFFSFSLGEGTIAGRVVGETLVFEWHWGTVYGEGTFQSIQEGNEFSGVWGYGESTDNGGEWHGRRQ